MKAMTLTGIRQMEMREVPDPIIAKPDDVLLKMKTVGVCGSDVHYYTTGRIGSLVVEYPFAVGHEGAAEVVAVGDAVQSLQPGDAVAIEPAMTCGHCDQCLGGRPNTCRNNRFLGCPGQAEGCLSEYIVMPESCCFPLRAGSGWDVGAISEPLAIGVYSVNNSISMKGAKIGILGMGPIGWSVMLPAMHEGAETIYTTDKVEERVALAAKGIESWGGRGLSLNANREDRIEKILEREPLGLDVIFECCGMQDALDDAVHLLKPGGKLMLIGIPEVDRISFGIDLFRRKEICLQNVRRQHGCVQRALDLIEVDKIDVDQMVTHRFPFEKSKEAFDLVCEYGDGVLKAMIDFD